MMSRFILVVAAALVLAGCNPVENLDQGEQQVTRFERVFSSGNVERLYDLTGESFREVTNSEEFADLHKLITIRLGKIVTSKRIGFNTNFTNGVTRTVIVMETEFEKGDGTQTYTFAGNGDDMELIGWQVNSPRLALTVDDLQLDEDTAE